MKLDGRKAAVTGAGRGIGKAIATKLASLGADVAIVDIDVETASSTAAEIASTGATGCRGSGHRVQDDPGRPGRS